MKDNCNLWIIIVTICSIIITCFTIGCGDNMNCCNQSNKHEKVICNNHVSKHETNNHANRHLKTCPNCGSHDILIEKKGFRWGQAGLGAFLLGGVGILGGFIDSNQLEYTCTDCGLIYDKNTFENY